MTLMPPPSYSGTFSGFFRDYVEPHLPSVQRVAEFDQFLRDYLKSNDPIYVIRYIHSQERGEICKGFPGLRILPTDNSPVWWLHEYLRNDGAITSASGFFSNPPAHMFKLPRGRKYLNALGFHAAHIINAKDGNVDWENWAAPELARRTLLNIHPCNMFLISKTSWMANGGRPDILQWIASEYQIRYGDVMRAFLNDVGVEIAHADKPEDPRYEYSPNAIFEKLRSSEIPGQKKPKSLPAIYTSSRPFISKAMLGKGIVLEIRTGNDEFGVEHDELVKWVGINFNALNTASWIEGGLYSWPKPSKKIIEFLRSIRV